MATATTDRSGSVVESHKGYDPRTIFFYFVMAGLLLYVLGGIAYQQLFKAAEYHAMERQQNQRRILIPGPRGNIYDREGRLLVGNRPRFAVSIHLDELQRDFRKEFIRVRRNYRELDDKDIPSSSQMAQIARFSVVQSYLDKVNAILGRNEKIDSAALSRHFSQKLLLPYVLIEDLKSEEYARLIEQLPVRWPVQVYASSTRYYPYKSGASHVLGYVQANDEIATDSVPGEGLATFKMRGTIGKIGIEAEYDNLLQGETGGIIYRVDPSGYRVDPPIDRRLPVQGRSITTSIDIDLQMAAEVAMELNRNDNDEQLPSGAAAIDIATGEVLVLASKPDYDLNDTSPRITSAKFKEIEQKKAWENRATRGVYAPGSTFKLLTAIAGLRSGTITTNSGVNCTGVVMVGGRRFLCHGGHGHGPLVFRQAISKSCNSFFYHYGLETGIDALAAEARRFHLDRPTNIELPNETRRMNIPDPAWKARVYGGEKWYPGDTANVSIGQGYVGVTPLQMACFTASVARGEVQTQPTLEHHANRERQHTEKTGLTPEQARALREGMEECITTGTGRLPNIYPPGIRIAGKTGTAQIQLKEGKLNLAWFICYAPAEKPEIAIAVLVEGDSIGEELAGGRYAAPIAAKILTKYFEKKQAKPLAPMIPTVALRP